MNKLFSNPGRLCAWVFSLSGLLLFSGCGVPLLNKKDEAPDLAGALQSAATPQTYAEGAQAYMDNDFDTASRKFGVFAAGAGSTAKGVQAIYWQGMSELALGNTERARGLFESVQGSSLAGSGYKAMALKGSASAYMAEKDYQKADASYRSLMAMYPADCAADEILAALIDCSKKRGDYLAVERYRGQLTQIDPDSPYLKDLFDPQDEGEAPDSYYVQAGLFSNRQRAYALQHQLKRKGIASIVKVKAGYYIVQAGSFSTSEAASAQAGTLKSKGFQAIVKGD